MPPTLTCSNARAKGSRRLPPGPAPPRPPGTRRCAMNSAAGASRAGNPPSTRAGQRLGNEPRKVLPGCRFWGQLTVGRVSRAVGRRPPGTSVRSPEGWGRCSSPTSPQQAGSGPGPGTAGPAGGSPGRRRSGGYPRFVAPLIIAGVGISMTLPTVASAALGAVPPADIGRASGVNNTLQRFGGAFGVAIVTAVFTSYGHLGAPASVVSGYRPALALSA